MAALSACDGAHRHPRWSDRLVGHHRHATHILRTQLEWGMAHNEHLHPGHLVGNPHPGCGLCATFEQQQWSADDEHSGPLKMAVRTCGRLCGVCDPRGFPCKGLKHNRCILHTPYRSLGFDFHSYLCMILPRRGPGPGSSRATVLLL